MSIQRIIPFFLLLLGISNSTFSQQSNKKISYQEYIDKYKQIAILKMQEYRIPASITLAQGLLESGSGNSNLAIDANNHFGIKCHKEWTGMTYTYDDDEKGECFRKYANPEESFNDHSLFLTSRPRYANLFTLDIHDYKGWAHGLKSAGYATNPRYAEMLIKIIEENELYLYDKSSSNTELYATINTPDPVEKEHVINDETSVNHPVKGKLEYVEIADGNRTIYVNNDVKLIIARNGDDAKSIAKDLGIHAFQVLLYNELGREETIIPGSYVYVEPKHKKAKEEFHVVEQGETMRDISQLYGIKLKSLYKKNGIVTGHEPVPGTKLYLKTNKPI